MLKTTVSQILAKILVEKWNFDSVPAPSFHHEPPRGEMDLSRGLVVKLIIIIIFFNFFLIFLFVLFYVYFLFIHK